MRIGIHMKGVNWKKVSICILNKWTSLSKVLFIYLFILFLVSQTQTIAFLTQDLTLHSIINL